MINSGPIICCISTQADFRLGVKQGRREGRHSSTRAAVVNVFPSKGDTSVGEQTFRDRHAWAQVPAISLITCVNLIDFGRELPSVFSHTPTSGTAPTFLWDTPFLFHKARGLRPLNPKPLLSPTS